MFLNQKELGHRLFSVGWAEDAVYKVKRSASGAVYILKTGRGAGGRTGLSSDWIHVLNTNQTDPPQTSPLAVEDRQSGSDLDLHDLFWVVFFNKRADNLGLPHLETQERSALIPHSTRRRYLGARLPPPPRVAACSHCDAKQETRPFSLITHA